MASIGAGVLHLTAASAHTEHALIFSFFIASGILQILWGAAVAAPNPTPLLLGTAALGNAGLVAVWLASRTSGLSFIAGADHREPVGVKDTVTVIFELFVIAGAYVLVAGRRSPTMWSRVSRRTLAPLAAATALLLIPGIVAPAHQHHDGEHQNGLLASGLVDHVGHSDATHVDALTAGHDHGSGPSAVRHAHAEQAVERHSAHVKTPSAGTVPVARRSNPQAPPPVHGIAASVRYGPFFMPPASFGGEAHYNRVLQNVAKPCSDCYMVNMKPDLVYADGSSANLDTGAMLHHAVWTRPSLNDTTCGRSSAIGSQGLRFFASGNERTVMKLPSGFGYRVGADPWTLIVEIMNHSQQPKTVYITLDVLYRPGTDALHDTTPVWMDVDNCGDSQYAIPAGPSETEWRWTSKITGRVVGTGGHVHDGGVKTVLTNASTNQHMCTSVAGYGRKPSYQGTIESMSTCTWDRIGIVRKGEDLAIRAYYDSAEAQDDVMGIMLAFVYETSNLSGGTTPPQQDQPSEQESSGGHHH